MDVELSIVIVSWNVAPLLRECLLSLLALPSVTQTADGSPRLREGSIQVVVVDNASTDGTVEMLRREFPWVEVLANPQHLGFTAGNNLGLAHSRGRFLLLLNPDTRFILADHVDPLAVMLEYLRNHPRVGVVGPRLIYADGRPQPSRRRFPNLAMALMESTLLEEWFPRNRWARAYRMEDVPLDGPHEVDWVTGAAMLVRREAWQEVGTLDEAFFMYSEELDWCRRFRQAGWEVVHLPQAVVMHYEGRSSEQVIAARHIHFETSKILYFRKYHGRLQAGFLRAFRLLSYIWRVATETAKYILRHKPSLRQARMRAYVQVLRSGLKPQRATEGTQ